MKRVCDYTIVSGRDYIELEQKVEHLLSEGWQPHGNAYLTSNAMWAWNAQPMVRYKYNEMMDV